MARIAVVNDDTAFLDLMHDLLEMEGYEVEILREADSAFAMIKESRPDAVIMDVRLDHQETGWRIAEMLTLDPETSEIPLMICSADLVDLRAKRQWLEQKGIGAIAKPFDLDDLLGCVEAALTGRTPCFVGIDESGR